METMLGSTTINSWDLQQYLKGKKSSTAGSTPQKKPISKLGKRRVKNGCSDQEPFGNERLRKFSHQ